MAPGRSYSVDHVEVVRILSRSFAPDIVAELAAKVVTPAKALEVVNNWRRILSEPPLTEGHRSFESRGSNSRSRGVRKTYHFEAPKEARLEWILGMIKRDRVPMIYTQEVVVNGSVRPVISIFGADPAMAVHFLNEPGYQVWSEDSGIY